MIDGHLFQNVIIKPALTGKIYELFRGDGYLNSAVNYLLLLLDLIVQENKSKYCQMQRWNRYSEMYCNFSSDSSDWNQDLELFRKTVVKELKASFWTLKVKGIVVETDKSLRIQYWTKNDSSIYYLAVEDCFKIGEICLQKHDYEITIDWVEKCFDRFDIATQKRVAKMLIRSGLFVGKSSKLIEESLFLRNQWCYIS